MAKVFRDLDGAARFVEALGADLVILDDKLYWRVRYPSKLGEGSPKPRYMDRLVLVADNPGQLL